MKKYFEKAATFLVLMLLLVPVFSTPAAARSYGIFHALASGKPLPIILFIVAVIGVIVYKRVVSDRRGKGKDDKFPGQINIDGLSIKDIEMINSFKKEVKKKKPDPISTRCPNCGAPLTLSDKVTCPYCRSTFVNNGTDLEDVNKPISPEEYNPRRYYEENTTGYQKLDIPPTHNSPYDGQDFDSFPYEGNPSSFGNDPYGGYQDRNNDYGSGFHSGDDLNKPFG